VLQGEGEPRGAAANNELALDDPAFDISDHGDVAALLRAERSHFWHRARNAYIAGKLRELGVPAGATVLELGCGAGCVAAHLSRAGYRVTGVDGHRALVEVACARAPDARFLCRDLRRPIGELSSESFQVVGLFDVIEHLDDPVAALEGALHHVRDGGWLVGTVPALMSLWSSIDVHAGHKTRYSESSLRGTLAGVRHARDIEISSFFRSLVPLMWAQRRLIARRGDARESIQNLTVPPRPVNRALLALLSLERHGGRLLRPLPGASLWFSLRAQGGAPQREIR
jgi:SAM-dependent methyltransferase